MDVMACCADFSQFIVLAHSAVGQKVGHVAKLTGLSLAEHGKSGAQE